MQAPVEVTISQESIEEVERVANILVNNTNTDPKSALITAAILYLSAASNGRLV